MENKLNLYEKIQAVSNEVKNITKNMTVGSGNYAYKAVSDLDVTFAVKKAETKFRIISVPMNQELISSEVVRTLKENKESLTYVDNIKMTVRLVDLDDVNSYLDIVSFGKGIDSGDKGFGKASTYARKHALLNVYKIASGEDPDAEKSKQLETKKTVSEKRIAVVNYLDKNNKLLQETLIYLNIGTLDDMTEANVELLYKTYTDKKLI